MSKKPQIVIFGAGKGGERARHFLRRKYDVVAFCDNNAERHGEIFCGRPIVSPASLKGRDGALVFIASQYAMEIYLQLTNDLGLPKERIEIVPDLVLVGEHDFPWLGVTALGIAGLFVVAILAAIIL